MSQLSQLPHLPSEIANLSPDWQKLYLNCPERLSRRALSELSGRMFKASTLANRDCKGTGPAVRLRFGSKVFYPREAAILWLAREIKEIPRKDSARETTW